MVGPAYPDDEVMCTDECGRLDPPDAALLAAAFAATTADAFAFLSDLHGMEPHPLEITDITGDELVELSEVRFPFLAVMEFSGPSGSVRISYGHREYHVAVTVAPDGGRHHGIQDWLVALGIESELADDSWVNSPPALRRHIGRLARLVRNNLTVIGNAHNGVRPQLGKEVVETAPTMNRRLEAAQEAFAGGDYRTFVDLLGSLEDVLTTTDRQRLAFARAKL